MTKRLPEHPPPPCLRVQEQILLLSGLEELPSVEEARTELVSLKAHLDRCPACRGLVASSRRIPQALKALFSGPSESPMPRDFEEIGGFVDWEAPPGLEGRILRQEPVLARLFREDPVEVPAHLDDRVFSALDRLRRGRPEPLPLTSFREAVVSLRAALRGFGRKPRLASALAAACLLCLLYLTGPGQFSRVRKLRPLIVMEDVEDPLDTTMDPRAFSLWVIGELPAAKPGGGR